MEEKEMAEWRNVTEEKYWGVMVARGPVPYVPRPKSPEEETTARQIREIEKEKELRKRLIMQNGYYPDRTKLIRILEEAFVILFSVTVAVALAIVPPLPYEERGLAAILLLTLLIGSIVAARVLNTRKR
jgi:hypothetical protein